jgi:hypothetical protein
MANFSADVPLEAASGSRVVSAQPAPSGVVFCGHISRRKRNISVLALHTVLVSLG